MTEPERIAAGLTQTDIDALWLAARLDISALDYSDRGLRGQAQLRLQRLADAQIINLEIGKRPILERQADHG